jgi:hypothetical protein
MAAGGAGAATGDASDWIPRLYNAGKIPDIVFEVKHGLAENGFIEGRNFKFEYRFAEFHRERIGALAADLVQGSSITTRVAM